MATASARALVLAAAIAAAGAVAVSRWPSPPSTARASLGAEVRSTPIADAAASEATPAPERTAASPIEAPSGSALASLLAALRALPETPTSPAATFLRRCEPDAIDLARALDVMPPPADADLPRILGQVVDARGAPVEGARVTARRSSWVSISAEGETAASPPAAETPGEHARAAIRDGDRAAGEATTDREGRFSIQVAVEPNREYDVEARVPGRGRGRFSWGPSARSTPRRIRLQERAVVRVRVEGWPEGTKHDGFSDYAWIILRGEDPVTKERGRDERLPEGDAPGVTAYEVTPGRWTADAWARTAQGDWRGISAPFDAVVGAAPLDVTIRAERRPILAIRVTIPPGDPARPDLRARVKRVGPPPPDDRFEWPEEFERVDEDNEPLFPEQPLDRALETVGAAPGELVETLRAALTPGTYEVSVVRLRSEQPFGAYTTPVTVEVGPSGGEARVRLDPFPGEGIVAVSFEGPCGEPLGDDDGVVVVNARAVARAGHTQWLEVGGASDAGPVRLWAVHGAYGARDWRLGGLAIDIPRPLPAALTVRFSEPAHLSVTVRDEHGRLLDSDWITVTLDVTPPIRGDEDDRYAPPLRAVADVRGRHVFATLQPGAYTATVHGATLCPGCRTLHGGSAILGRAPVEVPPGGGEAVVTLPAPVSLVVRAARAGEIDVRPAGDDAESARRRKTETGATVRFEGLLPGPYVVVHRAARFSTDGSPLHVRAVLLPHEGTVEVGTPEEGAPGGRDGEAGTTREEPLLVDALGERPAPLRRGPRAEDRGEKEAASEEPRGSGAATTAASDDDDLAALFPSAATRSATSAPEAPSATADPAALLAFDEAAARIAAPSEAERTATGTARITGVVRDTRGGVRAGVEVVVNLAPNTLDRLDRAVRDELDSLGLRADLAAALGRLHEIRSRAAHERRTRSGDDGAFALEGLAPRVHQVWALVGEARRRIAVKEGVVRDDDEDESYGDDLVRASGAFDVVIEATRESAAAEEVPEDEPTAEPAAAETASSASSGATAATPGEGSPESAVPPAAPPPPAPPPPPEPGPATLRVRFRGYADPADLCLFEVLVNGLPSPKSASPNDAGEAELTGLPIGPARLVVRTILRRGEHVIELEPLVARPIVLEPGVQSVEVQTSLAPLRLTSRRAGLLRLWRLDAGEPPHPAAELRIEGDERFEQFPAGRWLAVFEPERLETRDGAVDAPGRVPHLERRFTTPESTEIRFD